MVSVILKIVLGEKNHFSKKKKKKFILNTPTFGQYCGITHILKANAKCIKLFWGVCEYICCQDFFSKINIC